MNSKEYEKKILQLLERKYSRRKPGSLRSVTLKSTEILRNYDSPLVDLEERDAVESAIGVLRDRGWIEVRMIPFSCDVSSVILREEYISEIEKALEDLGMTTMEGLAHSLDVLIQNFEDKGELAQRYCRGLRVFEHLDLEHEQDVLTALVFLEHNEKPLYIREVSMLLYGDSKKFEKQVLSTVLSFLENRAEVEEEELRVLERYHILEVDQQLQIKGNLILEMGDEKLDLYKDWQGLSLSYSAALRITKITLKTPVLLSIENKTAYERFDDPNTTAFYLGGFANHQQIVFLKKVIQDNPGVRYVHAGDIDIGGFLIHQDLCEKTNQLFELFRMGMEQLQDPKYEKCLQHLSERDRNRAKSLLNNPMYKDIVEYMLLKNVKLEQEILFLK